MSIGILPFSASKSIKKLIAAKTKLAEWLSGKDELRFRAAFPIPMEFAIKDTEKIVSIIAGSTKADIKASRLLPSPPKALALSSPKSFKKNVDREISPVIVKASMKDI